MNKTQIGSISRFFKLPKGLPAPGRADLTSQAYFDEHMDRLICCNGYAYLAISGLSKDLEGLEYSTDQGGVASLYRLRDDLNRRAPVFTESTSGNPSLILQICDVFKAFDISMDICTMEQRIEFSGVSKDRKVSIHAFVMAARK